jgi:DNA mismatch endonuclease (patch repair protein)
MVDILRSHIMRSVPQKRTKPEMIVRRALHAAGYRFRTNLRSLPGSPDIAFSAKRKVIFVHGCFWHRHVDCRFATTPKNNNEFWQSKFSANVRRDQRNISDLNQLCWEVEVIWQCETQDMDRLLRRLTKFLGPTKGAS